MAPLKLFYLASEVAPFAETSTVATFSQRLSSILNDRTDVDIRLTKPKYGFISERKYVLREVIRLKEIPVNFDGQDRIVSMKSAFIPETRVQIYFMEDEQYFKPLPELIYKARNGRVFKDNDERFAFFARVALDTLKRLFWAPDVLICNDWQMSFIPRLLKEQYKGDTFYANMKSAFFLHTLNSYRMFSKDSFGKLDLAPEGKGKYLDNVKSAIEHADYVVAINDEKGSLMDDLKSNKEINKIFEQSEHLVVDLPKNASRSIWVDAANDIEAALREI
jgi:starch synthase